MSRSLSYDQQTQHVETLSRRWHYCNPGGSVADAFLNDKNWRIRAITRDPSKALAQEWTARDIEVVRADIDDVPLLTDASTGTNAIFAITDYLGPLANPAVRAATAEAGIHVN